MAFDCNNQRKPLLFSDLFKSRKNNMPPEVPKLEGPGNSSSSSSSSTQFLSSCDSSSSGFSTPLYSDLGSSEGEEGDFIAELTRQMAECMLQEEDEETEEKSVVNCVSEASSPVKSNADENSAISGVGSSLKNGFCSSSVSFDDQMPSEIQMKNQPPVSQDGPFCRGRRVKGTKSVQQKRTQKTEQQYVQYRARRNGHSGLGMQAVFLGGSGSGVGSHGTGVYLPRDPAELKTKAGCSTVLIPTRVLQVLELHFSRIQESTAPPLSVGSPKDETMTSNGAPPEQETRPVDGDEAQLPQEWTY